MKRIAQIISFIALAATLIPACLFFAGSIDLAQTKMAMLTATIVWFLATPVWMERGG